MGQLATKSLLDQVLDAVYRCGDPTLDIVDGRAAIDAVLAQTSSQNWANDQERQGLLAAIEPHLLRALSIRANLESLRANRANPAQLIQALARPAGLRTGAGEAILWNHSATVLARKLGFNLEATPQDWQRECRQAVRDGTAALSLGDNVSARLTHLSQATHKNTGMASAYGLETIIVELVKSAPSPIQLPILVPVKLTAAERDIIAKLATGMSINEIAATRSTSLATVRRQIKLLKAKTGRKTTASLASVDAYTH